MYLVENQGDPFHNYENAVEKGSFRFGDVLWYLLITASTVGYGDYYPQTDIGKIFGILVIACNYYATCPPPYLLFIFLVGVGGFAAMVPELATLLASGSKYGGQYKVGGGKGAFLEIFTFFH